MTTRRTAIKRGIKWRISPEAVDLYRRCVELRPLKLAHDEKPPKNCVTEACPACAEFRDKRKALRQLVGLMPWDRSPVDECSEDSRPQPWLCSAKGFDRVVEIKRLLEAECSKAA